MISTQQDSTEVHEVREIILPTSKFT